MNFDKCELRPLTKASATEIAQWAYPAPYDAYSFRGHPSDYLMDEKAWGIEQFALFRDDIVAAQVACQFDEGKLWIGWSLAPSLCGEGNGHLFVKKCVEEIRKAKNFDGKIVLRVAASNIRAVKAYQRAGFDYVETIIDEVAYSDHLEDFWVMELA